MNPKNMKRDTSALGELRDGYCQIELLLKKLEILCESGRRRVLTPDLLYNYRYLAKDTKAHIEAAIKLLEKKKGK